MNFVLGGIERALSALPFGLLEIWGRFAYFAGIPLALFAFGGFTFRLGRGWGLGRETQAWDAKAVQGAALTFVLVTLTGYLGSFVVLVPGAQTFESLKDLTVFLCIVHFGYPALVVVPFAYGLADLIEGVPPGFILDWLPGYFINPACFWIAYQLIGKDPDFRRPGTWGRYLVFVLLFLAIEPILWGHLCSGKFTPEISYRNITSALFFTTSLTWIMAPFASLLALPAARELGLFWAEIPGHVRERALGRPETAWESGAAGAPPDAAAGPSRLPLLMYILLPFIGLIMTMAAATAFVTLRGAERDADALISRLHASVGRNIRLSLDGHFGKAPAGRADRAELDRLLGSLPIAKDGLALIVDRAGRVAASSGDPGPLSDKAVSALAAAGATKAQLEAGVEFRFHVVTERPLRHATWLARATVYRAPRGGHSDWVLLTLLPEPSSMAGVKAGRSRTALIVAAALMLCLAAAAVLAALITRSLRGLAAAARGLEQADGSREAPSSRVEELDALARSFNGMAGRLARSVADLRAMADAVPQIVWATTPDGLAVFINHRWTEYTGLELEEALGEGWTKPFHPEDRPRAWSAWQKATREAASYAIEARLRRADGEYRWMLIRGLPLIGTDGKPVKWYGTCTDIHDLKLAELRLVEGAAERESLLKQLAQSQKLESIGRLAGGVAHDFNNILSAIVGFTELVLRSLPPGDARAADLQEVMASGERAARLTRQLLAFSRKQIMAPQVLELRSVVTGISQMLVRLLGENIRLVPPPPGPPCRIMADASQLEQVLVNLAINARDAMPQGGELTFETSVIPAAEAAALSRLGLPPGPLVLLTVRDTGAGMSDEVKARVFEPFFTTKEKGTGLGLSTVYGIIKQTGGEIEVDSAPWRGTVFRLYFPEADANAAREAPRPADSGVLRGSETILLVEDEEPVRRLLQRALAAYGYAVLTASGGTEALARLKSAGRAVDLLITDVVLPGMSGRDLARAVADMGMARRTLFISGHAEDAVVAHGVLQPGLALLGKPFTPEALARKIREVLDGPADKARA